jgi:hypothetical protein
MTPDGRSEGPGATARLRVQTKTDGGTRTVPAVRKSFPPDHAGATGPRRANNGYWAPPVCTPAACRMPSVTMPTFSTPAPLAASMTSTMSP